MNKSEDISEIAKALSNFQKEVKQPSKNGFNPHFKSEYVTLDDTIKAVNETAPKHGLSYIQTPVTDEHGIGVITTLLHTSGQFMEFPPLILPMDKKTAQGAGSCISYARRYSISSTFGLVSDTDDDGNALEDQSGQGNKQLSEKQVKRLYAIAKQAGVEPGAVKSVIMKDYNKTNIADLTKQEYDAVCGRLEQKKESA
jgi:hypothetical protein